MAKLTVFFRYKAIHSELFESGIVHIGRDETNDLTIDSLAVAPVHAVIILREEGNAIKQMNDNFPLIVNGERVKESVLNDNDMITLGKHDIVFSVTESVNQAQPDEPNVRNEGIFLNQNIDNAATSLPSANLQVMSGKNIGKVLALKKAMTRLGNTGSGVIVIAKRKDGYFVSALENMGTMTVNNVPLNQSYLKLSHNDVLVINDTSLQFFWN
jgi:pSer/pThr/pTyr-binding forkhead associated (FHA) protein